MSFPQFAYSLANASTTPPSSASASQMLLSPAPATPTSRSGAGCCETGRPLFTDPNTGQTVCSCQYPPGLLAAYPRLAGLSAESVYSSAYATGQTYLPLGADPSALYGSLEGPEALRSLAQGTPYYTYDPSTLAAYPYGYGAMDLNSAARRKNATRENTNTLKAWLYEHRKNPYPTKGEKIMLAIITKMTLTQVSTWFANARRRLKKENKMTWSPRTGSRDDDDDEDDDKNESDTETDRSNNNTNSNNGRCGASLDSPGGAGSTDTANKGGNILGKSDGMNSDGELHDEDEDEIIIDGGKEDDLLDDIDIENEEADSPSLNTHNAPRVSSGCVRKSPSPSTPGWTTHPRLSPSASSTLPNSSHRKESSHSEERKIEKCINNHKPNSQTMNKSSSSDGIKTCTTSESSASSKAKPRIWSLADVATSESPPQSSRRSPPCYPSPRDMVRPYPSQPLPAHAHGSATGINGLRSWLNGAAYMGGLPHPYLLTGATLGVDSRGIPVSTYGLLPTTSGFNPSATAASYTPQHKNTLGNEFKHETLKTSVSRERDEAAFKPINRRMPPS